MKEGFRQCMAWLHTWVGLVAGWVLFFVFVTGSAGYFDDEIDRWMRPELPLAERAVEAVDRDAMLERALDRLETTAPAAREWHIELPGEALAPRGPRGLVVEWQAMPGEDEGRAARGEEALDPATGEPIAQVEPRATGGGQTLYRMHYLLHYLPTTAGVLLVGVCTMMMFVAILSGVITHKQIFKDFFTFRPGKGQRSWLDAHNVTSVMALPFFLMITYTGLVLFPLQYMPAAVFTLYGSSQAEVRTFIDEFFEIDRDKAANPVRRPQAPLGAMVRSAEREWGAGQVAGLELSHSGDDPPVVELRRVHGGQIDFRDPERQRFDADTGVRLPSPEPRHATGKTRNVLYGLHEGLFAGPWLRWLYFASGVLGCVMTATGLVLWTVKRRKRHARGEGPSSFDRAGLRLVEVLNVATIAGLPVAVAAYFWANRLLPTGMAARAEWEVHVLFLVWAALFLHASLRSSRQAWREQLWLAVAAFGLLPMVNLLTTQRHLGVTLPHGDWALAGFDLTVLGLAGIFVASVLKLRRHWGGGGEGV